MLAVATATLRIMLVDDHPIVRRGLRDILVNAFTDSVIHEVGSGREAVTLVRSHPWHVMILDLRKAKGADLRAVMQYAER